ncbi:hypothetical protein CHGG_04959 [Chaetomium globosum CBS 148.51]|uniref:Uncharacterized protein n=1 Tax=Chaetomium globosum (strain ATCC 6205 / CBS 148.51 / DSM 1962 / NBRC 6347 / NRRL 1970) TaxID=306901 RepID=Q2GZT7_CHAGB|nr:uncharacterized protein CHGG_04959 [Chaetomium globosum CBS 148.51]EAQ88340.1 hypothetical protein CHGG_04959 [Chaetomium globosum CBS 148.51]
MAVLSAIHGISSVILSNLFVTLPLPQAHPDLANQTIIVTGANTGLGLETSRHLLRLGVHKLIMAVRNPEKGAAARDNLLLSTSRPASTIEIWPLDMADPTSILSFTQRAARELPRLDGVLANAGLMTQHFTLTAHHEQTLTVNVLHTFLLCLLLLPTMRASTRETGYPCRFAIPNSGLHYVAPLGELATTPDGESLLQRLDDPARADMAGRYPLSKVLVLWGVRELAARLGGGAENKGKEGGVEVIINTPNPSYCVSSLGKEGDGPGVGMRVAEKLLARTTEEGSRALFHGLVAGVESQGQYLTNCHVQT